MKNRTENISVRYRPQHLTKSRKTLNLQGLQGFVLSRGTAVYSGSIINVVVLMKIKATTFIFLRTKKHDKFLIKY